VGAALFDVDADGDPDLVANTGSLDRAVWINDGSGRLTKARPAVPSHEWAPLPSAPSVDGGGVRLDVLSPDAGASVAPLLIRGDPAPAPSTSIALAGDVPSFSSFRPSSAPRAPPLA